MTVSGIIPLFTSFGNVLLTRVSYNYEKGTGVVTMQSRCYKTILTLFVRSAVFLALSIPVTGYTDNSIGSTSGYRGSHGVSSGYRSHSILGHSRHSTTRSSALSSRHHSNRRHSVLGHSSHNTSSSRAHSTNRRSSHSSSHSGGH